MDERTMLLEKRRPNIDLFISGEFQKRLVPKNICEDPIWKSLCNVFKLCTQTKPELRPSTSEIQVILDKIEKGEEISMPDREITQHYSRNPNSPIQKRGWLVPILVAEGISEETAIKYEKIFNQQNITTDLVDRLTYPILKDMGIPISDVLRMERAFKQMKIGGKYK